MTRLVVRVTALALVWFVGFGVGPAMSAAVDHALIQGSGSSWAANAVNQWVADAANEGMQVVYTANGAAQGRKDYANKATDFGVTDSPYRGADPTTGQPDNSNGRAYAYLPIVAGGTSFPYNVTVGGKRVANLRLSGETIAKIFTNQITNWNDPQITADNNGHALPSIPIIPVVRADGAGVTNQFTTWLVSQFPDSWQECNGGKLAPSDYFPVNCGKANGPMKAQSGSDGVMNFVKSKNAVGAIAMEEYSYPLMAGFPVAKVLNNAGYYTLPTQYNVAVALTAAEINQNKSDINYLTQKLDKVYVNSDPRTYPLSSYVYAIIPTASNDSRMSTAKRQTIADFLYHSICQGQSEIGPIGYSPLPVNLVQAGFEQIAKLKDADSAVDLDQRDVSTCHNPTFIAGKPDSNYLAQIAPQPAACDKIGADPCAAGVGAYNLNPGDGDEVPAGGSGQSTSGSTKGAKSSTKGSASGASTGSGASGSATDATDPAVPGAVGDVPTAGEAAIATGDVATRAEPEIVPTTLTSASPSGGASVGFTALVAGVFLGSLVIPAGVSVGTRRLKGGRR